MGGQSRKDTRGVMSGFTVVVADYRIEATYGAYGHFSDTDHLEMGGQVVILGHGSRVPCPAWKEGGFSVICQVSIRGALALPPREAGMSNRTISGEEYQVKSNRAISGVKQSDFSQSLCKTERLLYQTERFSGEAYRSRPERRRRQGL